MRIHLCTRRKISWSCQDKGSFNLIRITIINKVNMDEALSKYVLNNSIVPDIVFRPSRNAFISYFEFLLWMRTYFRLDYMLSVSTTINMFKYLTWDFLCT